MRLFVFCATLVVVAFVLVGCGEPERAKPAAMRTQPFHGAGDFDEVGTITFYPGESCASQIMFVFHGGGSTSTSMAAPFQVSKILNDAAREHKTVHVLGKWRRGKTADCIYVEATEAEARKSFW
jgi:hypothetical protein